MAERAQYATTPRYEIAVCSVANTAYDGSGTIVPLFTAGPNGSRIDAVGFAAQGSTTDGRLSVFFRKSSSDTWRWIFSFGINALTVSATQPPEGGGATNLGWLLTAGAQIGIAPTKGEEFVVHITSAGDF